MGNMSEEQVRTFVRDNINHRIDIGPRVGASKTFKVIDESNGSVFLPFFTSVLYCLFPVINFLL